MQTDRMVDVLETHTEGQVVRTVTGGVDTRRIQGASVAEKVDSFLEEYGWLQDFLAREPRGHSNLVGSLPVEPTEPEADIGYIFFDNSLCLADCGDAVIGSTTALVETGVLGARERMTVEVPAGLVETRLQYDGDRVESVAIQGMESFTYTVTSVTVETDAGALEVPVEVAYGGNWFAFVDPGTLDLSLALEDADSERIVDYGVQIRDAVNDALEITNPLTGESERVSITMFIDEGGDGGEHEGIDRGTIVYAAGSIGRSPCGTGTAAHLARLYANDQLAAGESYPIDSLYATRFTGRILDVETRDNLTVTTCEVAGSAHIVGKHTYLRDPADDYQGPLM